MPIDTASEGTGSIHLRLGDWIDEEAVGNAQEGDVIMVLFDRGGVNEDAKAVVPPPALPRCEGVDRLTLRCSYAAVSAAPDGVLSHSQQQRPMLQNAFVLKAAHPEVIGAARNLFHIEPEREIELRLSSSADKADATSGAAATTSSHVLQRARDGDTLFVEVSGVLEGVKCFVPSPGQADQQLHQLNLAIDFHRCRDAATLTRAVQQQFVAANSRGAEKYEVCEDSFNLLQRRDQAGNRGDTNQCTIMLRKVCTVKCDSCGREGDSGDDGGNDGLIELHNSCKHRVCAVCLDRHLVQFAASTTVASSDNPAGASIFEAFNALNVTTEEDEPRLRDIVCPVRGCINTTAAGGCFLSAEDIRCSSRYKAYCTQRYEQVQRAVQCRPVQRRCCLSDTVCFSEEEPIAHLLQLGCAQHWVHPDCLVLYVRQGVEQRKEKRNKNNGARGGNSSSSSSSCASPLACPACMAEGTHCLCPSCEPIFESGIVCASDCSEDTDPTQRSDSGTEDGCSPSPLQSTGGPHILTEGEVNGLLAAPAGTFTLAHFNDWLQVSSLYALAQMGTSYTCRCNEIYLVSSCAEVGICPTCKYSVCIKVS